MGMAPPRASAAPPSSTWSSATTSAHASPPSPTPLTTKDPSACLWRRPSPCSLQCRSPMPTAPSTWSPVLVAPAPASLPTRWMQFQVHVFEGVRWAFGRITSVPHAALGPTHGMLSSSASPVSRTVASALLKILVGLVRLAFICLAVNVWRSVGMAGDTLCPVMMAT